MSDSIARILLVEDEPALAELIGDYLRASYYEVEIRNDGGGIVEEVRRNPPDLMLLDLMLPGCDGLTICREVRSFSNLPILILTARVEEIDKLLGLELGADDYICKPASPREVVARVKAVLRRTLHGGTAATANPLQLDAARLSVRVHGNEMDLTPVEFRILNLLAERPGWVFSRNQILDRIYDDQRDVSDRSIDSHIRNLRRKLNNQLAGQNPIRSVYGVGYKLCWEEEPA